MYGNQYDTGASQFGGGGFMPSPAPDQATGSQAKQRFTSNQTLRAVTIKQLYLGTQQASDDNIRVDGMELNNITLVGKIRSVQEAATNVNLQIDDGTGIVEVKYWIDQDEPEAASARRSEWRAGVYVRIHGHLRPFDGQNQIVAFNIRPITDSNEITYHFLQCCYQHAHFTRGQGQQIGGSAAGAPAVKTDYSAPAAATGNESLNSVQQDAMSVYNSAAKHFTVDQVVEQLHSRYSRAQIQDAIAHLADDGLLYTTVDEHHHKSTSW